VQTTFPVSYIVDAVSAVWIVAADAFRAMLADVLRLPPAGSLEHERPAVGLPVSEMVWTALQHASRTVRPRRRFQNLRTGRTPRLKRSRSSFAPTVPGA